MSSDDPTQKEQLGDLEEEKTFHNEKLGGAFTFRLPFVYDELAVLRRRAQIMGVPENLAGPELLALSHSQAMFEVYNVQAPRSFKMDKQRSWAPFIDLMTEVRDWHDQFFRSMGPKEEPVSS